MGESPSRGALAARWLELTRTVLPAMAAEHRWPIRLDHCFMRVCLDAAIGRPWTQAVARPAIRHLTDPQLAQAVRMAEAILARPETLPNSTPRACAGGAPLACIVTRPLRT